MQDITNKVLDKIEGGLSSGRSAVRDEQREAPGVQTPTTDRGVTVTWMGVHWLTGVCHLPAKHVREVLSKHMYGLTFEDSVSGIWTYQYKAVERCSKAFLAWSDHQPGNSDLPRTDLVVNLPGEACEMLGTKGLLDLVRELGLEVTRLDLAWDTDVFTPREVFDTWKAGNHVSHVKKKPKWIEEEHDTCYIGSRSAQNARMVRFYNRRGPTRVELELHKKRADIMWKVLNEMALEDWSAAGLHYLVDFIDFRDRSADLNVGRCPRLDWWEVFTDGASRLSLPIPRKAPDLEAQDKWLQDGVSAALATVALSKPNATDYVLNLLKLGKLNMKPRHQALLAVVLAEAAD